MTDRDSEVREAIEALLDDLARFVKSIDANGTASWVSGYDYARDRVLEHLAAIHPGRLARALLDTHSSEAAPTRDYVPCDEPGHPKRRHFCQQMKRLAASEAAPVVGLDPQALTDAINLVWKQQPGLVYAGFVYGETGAAVAREYARLTQTRTLGGI